VLVFTARARGPVAVSASGFWQNRKGYPTYCSTFTNQANIIRTLNPRIIYPCPAPTETYRVRKAAVVIAWQPTCIAENPARANPCLVVNSPETCAS
jgi:hypothetical protein